MFYIHVVVLLRYLPILDGKRERFVTKNGKAVAELGSDRELYLIALLFNSITVLWLT